MNSSKRVTRAIASLASSSVFALITIAIGFIATPLLLHYLGDERFGALRTLSDWSAFLLLFDLGLGGALAACVSRAVCGGPSEVAEVIEAGAVSYRRVAISVTIGALVIAIAAPWIIPVSDDLTAELRLAAAIGITAGLVTPFGVFRAALEAMQRSYVVNFALTAQSMVVVIGGVVLAANGAGLPGVALATAAGGIVYASWLLLAAKSIDSKLVASFVHPHPTLERKADLKLLGRPTLLSRLSGMIALQTDTIIIAIMLGTSEVAAFFVTIRLVQLGTGQLQSIGSASWAGLAQMHHDGDAVGLKARVLELTRLTVTGGVALLGTIVVFNAYFVSLWVGFERFQGNAITLLAGINGLLLAVVSLWTWLFGGVGKVGLVAPVSILSAGVNIIVSCTATWKYGAIGPLLGTLVALLTVQTLWLPRLLSREFGFRQRDLAAAVLLPFAIAIVPIVIAKWILLVTDHAPNWPMLVIEMGGLFVACLSVGWVFAITESDRALWRTRMIPIQRRLIGRWW
ncbi:lipopolysaccharide biosynthesis protein [Novipirellula sp. SH528]|uniref:lipopolysaccharide biosynthesis protein n=1 Tax=Novipirellula sp. SH528 TaxID=3454466 RepID=UPI003FA12D4D